jgi:2-polyprenyl-3-methyl-5-hydroxy-6-metoxy-1,4-benzoquinol methylase
MENDTSKEKSLDSATCMLCGNEGVIFVNNLRDDNSRWVVRCNACGHIQVYPLPELDEDVNYYKENYEKNADYTKAGYFNESDIKLMNKFEDWARYYVQSVKPVISSNQKILEIGSGYGWFVEKMKNEGYIIDGVEVGQDRAQLAYHRSGIKLINHNFMFTPLETMSENYDVICMFHVLEHISDPLKFLNNVKKCLKPFGKLIVEVPNYDDYIKQLSLAYNNAVYFRAHLSYFTPDTLTATLGKTGFSEIKINGVQRYSVENAIRWIRTGKPNTEYLELELPEGLEWVNQHYKDVMEKELKSYAIMGIATLKGN